MAVVEPVLNEEKLTSLLAMGHEQPTLDYKKWLDLAETRDVVELTKDVAAMQSNPDGGYIVIGADDQGKVVSDMTEQLARHFDEANLRAKLKKYITGPFTIHSSRHSIEGNIVILIYVAPSEQGWCVFALNGEYGVAGGKTKLVFRVGEVFVRHGTASERWENADRERLIQQIIARRKEAWRAEYRDELTALATSSVGASNLGALPTSALTWRLDADGFDELVTELIRRKDDVPLRRMLAQAPADAGRLLDVDSEELATLLDRLTSFGALSLHLERRRWLDRVLKALVAIYELGFDENGYERSEPPVVQMWLAIISRVTALGGLAVRLEDWDSVRLLADRRPQGDSFRHFGSWLRHAVTMAARAKIIETENQAGLIARAHNVIRVISTTHPDMKADSERVLDSLCWFDALGCFVVIDERKKISSGNFYPSFSHYYSRRGEPAFKALIINKAMRRKIFTGDDQFLADTMLELNRVANNESFRYNGWDGLEDPDVRGFIESNRSA